MTEGNIRKNHLKIGTVTPIQTILRKFNEYITEIERPEMII